MTGVQTCALPISFFPNTLDLNDITCPLTQGILIEPVKTNCNHHFEKVALALQLRTPDLPTHKNCNVCRARITSADLDHELIGKIQNQFAKISEENRAIFDEQTRKLANAEEYNDSRGLPVIPPRYVSTGADYLLQKVEKFIENDDLEIGRASCRERV